MAKPSKYTPFSKPGRKWYGKPESIAPACMQKLTSGAWRAAEDIKVYKLKRQLGS